MNIEMLFYVNLNKFRETAKGKTYEQFIAYLQEQQNFKIIFQMTENEKKMLYFMAKNM